MRVDLLYLKTLLCFKDPWDLYFPYFWFPTALPVCPQHFLWASPTFSSVPFHTARWVAGPTSALGHGHLFSGVGQILHLSGAYQWFDGLWVWGMVLNLHEGSQLFTIQASCLFPSLQLSCTVTLLLTCLLIPHVNSMREGSCVPYTGIRKWDGGHGGGKDMRQREGKRLRQHPDW